MRPDDILDLLRRQPFTPIRLHLSNGRVFDVRHPDQAIVLRSRVIVGVPKNKEFADHVEHIALVHIAQIEEIPAEAA